MSNLRREKDAEKSSPEPTHDAITHRRAVRWMHWLNFPLLAIMIWSGFRIYWADVRDPNVVGVGSVEVVTLFPRWFNSALNLEGKLAAGLSSHLVFGWLFAINGLAYTIYTIRSGHWRDLNPGRRGLIEAGREVVNTFKGKHSSDPSNGYNPAQRIAYNLIVVLGGLSVATGLAIFRPNTLRPLTTLFGGYQTAKDIHFVATLLFIGFFFVHVAQVLRAGRAALVPMIASPKPLLLPHLARVSRKIRRPPSDVSGSDTNPTPTVSSGRRAVLTAGLTLGISYVGWDLFQRQPKSMRLPTALRSGHDLNEDIWRPIDGTFDKVRTYEPSQTTPLRVNGRHGLSEPVDIDAWELQLRDLDSQTIDVISMDDIRTLPEVSITTEHVCIEGWSDIVTWTGIRFIDFVDTFGPEAARAASFVNFATPDEEYYVSLDIESAVHPNTLLAYSLNGDALTSDHGAPLRLATPLKYGIKQLKRIGTITFADQPGPDYWTERGYDWYAHL